MKRGGFFGAMVAAVMMAAGNEEATQRLHDYFLRLPRHSPERPRLTGNRAQRMRQASGFRAMGTA